MPTYALLGATGATGSAVLHSLLHAPPADLKLNILVRSRAKLLRAFPYLDERSSISIAIIEGNSTDPAALSQCLEDANAVFMCVADNASNRGVSLTHDTVAATTSVLRTRRDALGRQVGGKWYSAPTILQLRSASLNPKLSCQVPKFVFEMVSFCLHYNHEDVLAACRLYEAAAKEGLLSYVYVDPPTIHDAFGTKRTGHALIPCIPAASQNAEIFVCAKQETALSYADLGAAFVDIAIRTTETGEFRNQPVGVTATGKVKATWGVLASYLADGAKGRVKGYYADGKNPSVLGKNTSAFLYCVPLLATALATAAGMGFGYFDAGVAFDAALAMPLWP